MQVLFSIVTEDMRQDLCALQTKMGTVEHDLKRVLAKLQIEFSAIKEKIAALENTMNLTSANPQDGSNKISEASQVVKKEPENEAKKGVRVQSPEEYDDLWDVAPDNELPVKSVGLKVSDNDDFWDVLPDIEPPGSSQTPKRVRNGPYRGPSRANEIRIERAMRGRKPPKPKQTLLKCKTLLRRENSKCFACGHNGHMDTECATNPMALGGGCYNCGSVEHKENKCPKPMQPSRVAFDVVTIKG
ncbi:hypothetical protein niasHT_011718 [Heterodera trifolii]|uniref:CCHC-type domain-containing protein n=1 Tax=Heterodera trifolii TaxID=157864 RepID=A0ABD2KXL2_9BILA